jgi:hypothetical protein
MPGARHLTPVQTAPQRISLLAVLRLLDARAGSYAEVRPAQSGLLRVCAYLPETTGGTDISWLRMLLVADVLLRAAELRNLQVLTVLVSAGQDRAQVAAHERAAGVLGIHPPAARADMRDAPDGPIDVHLVSQDADPHGSQNGLVARVGSAYLRGTADHDWTVGGTVLARPGQDPLAIRLALMSLPYYQQADLAEPVLASAQETAAHWRHQVAGWAESPSKPIPPPIAATFRAAFGDLDTPTVLALLHDLTRDVGLPAGAKFETFLYADRVLGLDLPRDIGRASG